MPTTSCHYALFGEECWRISLRGTWCHFVTVMHAMDANSLEGYAPRDELMDWADNSMNQITLTQRTSEVLEKMGLPRMAFVVFAFDVDCPEGARVKHRDSS